MAKPQAIRAGYYVAISLVPGTAPCNCYIGLVQAVDEFGLRMDLEEVVGGLQVGDGAATTHAHEVEGPGRRR